MRDTRKTAVNRELCRKLVATIWSIVLLLLAVPAIAAVPGSPTIGAVWYGRGGATVNFTPPASNGGKTITGYTVLSSSAGGIDSNAGSTGLSHVVTGLTFGTVYTFSVTATNGDGIGSPSVQSLPVTARPYSPATGTINNIVVFIRFNGQPEFSQPLSYYDRIFNTPPSSLKSFYQENSYNALTVNSTFYPSSSGTGVVSYQDANPVSYYSPYNATTNVFGYQSNTEMSARSVALVTNALNAVSSQIPGGLNLDGDSDGYVDHITFEVYSTNADPIPVMFNSNATFDTTGAITLKGKKVGSYAWVTAPQDSTYSAYSLGDVEIHEMGHNFGFPDLRNNFNGFNPVGNWDFMANASGVVHNGAYMKYKIGGWIPAIPAIASTSYGTYAINDITQSTNNSYKITLPNTNEFLILEYRPATGAFESRLPGKGLCISRVNEAAGLWGNMNGNPATVPVIPFYLYYFRPGGTFLSDGSAKNLFTCLDAAAGQTQFNDYSNPACFLSDGSPCGISIYNIGTAAGSSISFTLGNPATTTVTHAISGNVSYAATPTNRVSGVTVTLSGSAAGSVTTTTSTPSYLFTVNAGGNYTVTPTMANVTFNPASATVTSVIGDQALHFTATKITRTISGTVTSGGAPLSGATLYIYSTSGTSCSYYNAGNTLTTTSSGTYSFTVDAGSSCDLTAAKTGLAFTPSGYKTFANITADQVQNFATNITELVTSVSPSSPGQGVTFTANVFGNSPTGTVTFTDDGTVLCSAVALSLVSGQKKATCGPLTALAAGNHSIVAAYISGDVNNSNSSSSTLTQLVKTSSSTALGSSVNPSYFGQNITFTATVTGSTPTGTVTFSADGIDLCTAVALSNGHAQCSISSLAMGNHSILAAYSGDGFNTGSSSSALTQVVKLPLPTIQAAPDTSGTVGLTYAFYITATNTTSITVSDPVPPGFTVISTGDPNIWLVNWIPTVVAVYSNIIVTAHNSDWQTTLSPFSVTVKLPLPTIDGRPATVGMVGIPYRTFAPTPCDLSNPHFTTCYATSFSITPSAPPGMNFNTTTGVLSSTPTIAGTYSNLSIRAVNSEGSTALPAFSITISPRIDSFTAAKSMTTPRQYHSATTLPNGKVLVTGGINVNFYTPLDTAELYDPVTGNWSSAGTMAVARTNHAATLLKDGRVLVTGGYGNAGLLNSVELYDPAITSGNPWTTVSPMIFGHSSHTATKLANPDGSVLVMGGFNPDPDFPDYIVMVELYNPITNSWAAASQMTEWRSGFTATLLADGKVLVAGGGNTYSAELYDAQNDPALNSSISQNSNPWSATAHPLIVNRSSHTATTLPNGKVLVAGGINSSTGYEISSAELYDPAMGTWSATGSMATVRQSHAATLLSNGTVLVTGGVWRNSYSSNAYHDYVELYNPVTATWNVAGIMTAPRTYHSAALLSSGDVLVAGGSSDGISVLASSELYHYFYTVSFISNGGSAVSSQSVTYNTLASLPSPPTRSGYNFVGWYSNSGLTSAFAFTTPISRDTTLYAKWTTNNYTVIYNSNTSTGGTAPVDGSSPYVAGSNVTVLPAGSLVKTGFIFNGWNSTANGSGTNYTVGTSFIMGSDNMILYAQFYSALTQKPGDCNGDGTVTIDEVQSAINMFLGLKVPVLCVDTDSSNSVSIAEVQKTINSFLGL